MQGTKGVAQIDKQKSKGKEHDKDIDRGRAYRDRGCGARRKAEQVENEGI